MASDPVLDIDSLLEPVSDDNPVGTDIREDPSPTSAYHAIKDARKEARTAERKNLSRPQASDAAEGEESYDPFNREAKKFWQVVSKEAPKVLKEKSKDLEVLSWYIEALARTDGFPGLRDGFTLARRMVETYWDDIYPLPDEIDGMRFRTGPIAGLNGEGGEGILITPIKNIPLIEGDFDAPLVYWRYQQAIEIKGMEDLEKKAAREAETGLAYEKIQRALDSMDDKVILDYFEDLEILIDEIKKMGAAFDERCDTSASPPIKNLVSVVDDCLRAVKHMTDGRFAEDAANEGEQTEGEDGGAPTTRTAAAGASGPVQNREDALKQLRIISEFFRKTEPHSPLPYILERAVSWGRMPFAELMQELIPNSDAQEYFGNLTGMRFGGGDEE